MSHNLSPGCFTRNRSVPRLFFVIVLLIGIIAGSGCGSVVVADNFETFIRIPLGHERNVVDITKPLFLGHRVTSFRLRVKFVNGSSGIDWLNGMTLSFSSGSHVEEIDSLPAIHEDGEFWTQMIPRNKVLVKIKSNGVVFFRGGSSPYLDIKEVEFLWMAILLILISRKPI